MRTPRCTRPSRWAGTRPTSSPSPTTTPASRGRPSRTPGRARAMEIGRQARARPRPRRSPRTSARCPTTAASRRRSSRRSSSTSPGSSSCPRRRSTGSSSPRSSTTSARSAIPEEILEKPAALSTGEWRSVVQHPRIGQVILEQAAALKDAVPIILHHHERYAGHGYPYGLRANEIPLGARIVAIADAYDAMIHDRPYKRADDPRPGDRRAAAPRRDPVRPGAGQPVLRPVCGARAAGRTPRSWP